MLADITDIPWEAITAGLVLFAVQLVNAWLARNANRKADVTQALAAETKVVADQTKIVTEANHRAGNSMLTGVREQMVVMAELLMEAKPNEDNQARLNIAKRDLEAQLKSQSKMEAAVEAKATK